MCGIIGYAKGIEPEHENVNKVLDSGLRRLTYRGYDSWGTALNNTVNKATGEYPGDTHLGNTDAQAGIGHVRWATHGGVTLDNAHPHESCDKRFAVVHNGVIENHAELKDHMQFEDDLEERSSHEYTSETDTEVIAHWMEKGDKPAESLKTFDDAAEGNYAIVVLDRETDNLYALKRGSPLVFGYEYADNSRYPEGAYFGSDLYALSDKIEEAFFMKDGDIIMTSGSNLGLMRNGEWVEQFPENEWKNFEWTEKEPVLDKHDYWMEKEIKEIPDALKRLKTHLTEGNTGKKLRTEIENADKVVFTASGTSYHATLLGAYYLNQQGINAQTLIASEFENYQNLTDNTLVIAVSQSGETRDVLDAIQTAREQDATIASLVNTPYSTIQRKSDLSLEIKAQQENCVAATKTFTNQVYTLMHLAGLDNLNQIPEKTAASLHGLERMAEHDAEHLHENNCEDIYIIGDSTTYPLAREIALKLKEIPYIHAEGMMAGELKHGTLALIEEGTPVIALDDGTGSIETSVEEVEARGGNTYTMHAQGTEEQFVFESVIYGFFLALYWADLKNLPVDRPRNLAKSVTVK